MNDIKGKFEILYVDPPWKYSKKSYGRTPPYKTMDESELVGLGVDTICDDDCILLLWATCPKLDQAFRLMKAWGFEYKTVWLVWNKTCKNGKDYNGCGFWVRGNVELILLGVRGKPFKFIMTHSHKQVLSCPVTKHSEKPKQVYDIIDECFGNERSKIELFARNKRDGWISWGDQL